MTKPLLIEMGIGWKPDGPGKLPMSAFDAITVKGPKLSKAAQEQIKWWMDWEDNSWRNVMGTEPPWLSGPSPPRS